MAYTQAGAIEALQNLADEWPDDLMLFGWSGNLYVIPRAGWSPEETPVVFVSIDGIAADGGDPGWDTTLDRPPSDKPGHR